MENKKLQQLQKHLERARAELWMFYEISNLMRITLKLNEVLYIILTCVTSHEGLGFNRAMLFLVNERKRTLEGKMGIGPDTAEEADKIWKKIEAEKTTLGDLVRASKHLAKRKSGRLDKLVKSIKIPLKESAGILALTVLESMTFEITTDEVSKKVKDPICSLLKTEHFVTVPLRAKEKTIGLILVDNLFTKEPITKDDIRILTMFANQAGLAIENSHLYEKTVSLSHSDSLTNLINHGRFQYLLSKEIKRASRIKKPVSLIMIDIDNFKKLNDTFGHPAGDEVLVTLSKLFKKTCRSADIVARYGGEEFAIVLPDTHKESAWGLAERLRQAVEDTFFSGEKILPHKKLTISLGLASYPYDAKNKDKLILKADAALYQAKAAGKNRTHLYSQGMEQKTAG
ncbi:MAG: sensor domain-containing diguanylate cyclase [Candidatus Omnitrophica bacterium]|nr:sensor domain-containing diguanylate cyclase [Candidatus Omnitrophota bacterium]